MLKIPSINKEIFKIAIPNILGNITVPLIGIIDTYLMGHEPIDSVILIGAIALGGVIFNAIYWNFGFLRVGTTGITAQSFGENNKSKQAVTLFRAVIVGLFIALIILALQRFVANLGFDLLTNEENQQAINYAKVYFDYRIWAVPAVMMLFGLNGWYYGMQNAVYPLILTFTVNITNVLLSVYFVKVKGMGVEGVALGTVIAQYVCLIVAFILLLYRYRWVFQHLKVKLLLQLEQLKQFFFVSGFVFGRNIMLFLVFSGFTYFSSAVSKEYFAINEMLLQLFYFMSFAVDGFAYASEALVGKYTGAKRADKLKETIRWTVIWGLGFGILYAIVYYFFGEYFLGFFTPNDELIAKGKPYLFWLSIISIVGAIAFIWDGIYIGATLVVQMFISMTIATISFFVVFFLFKGQMPKHAIWLAMTTYMGIRGLMQWILYSQFLTAQKKLS